MISPLKFVSNAVARKDYVPALTCFRIKDKFVKAYNGGIGLCSPIDLDIIASPKASQLLKALGACEEGQPIALTVATNGKLLVSCGSFRTFVECQDPELFPDIQPEGQEVRLNGPILPAIRYLEPFIAEDASRPWACGLLLDGECAYATNNIVLVEYWMGAQFPIRVSLPSNCINELLRIGEEPERLQVTENRIVFHFSGGRWLSSQLLVAQWPDVHGLFDRCADDPQQQVNPLLWDAIEKAIPFADDIGRCYLLPGRISTNSDDNVTGTSITCAHSPGLGCYNGKHLFNLRTIIKTVAWNSYPKPVMFYGEVCRGIIAGITR